MVGPGRTQEIYAGSFATQGAKDKLINDLNELAVSTQRAGGANPIALFNLAYILAGDLQKKEAPEAYLIYALYDQDSNRYEVGKKVLSRNAANQHEILEEEMYISKDGYMETFVVNETSEDVWFDNMMVMSVSSVIVQETHYDPWGLELTGLGFQYGGIKANKFLYNGKELIEDNGLQYYDYGARMYDPAIGRWGVVDPMADQRSWVSPYNFVQNNPLNRIDPDGAFDWVINEDTNEYAWMNEVKSEEDTPEGHRYVGASIEDVLNDFSKDLAWNDFFSKADINFSSWPGELSDFEPNAAGKLKEKIGDMPFPISTVINSLYETVDNAYVSTFQLGGNRSNLEGFGVGRGEVTDAGVNTLTTVVPYSKVARVSGLSASQFSSMLKGTNVNKTLYRAGSKVRGWANKAFNYVYSRQVDYSIKAASGGAKAIEKKDKN